MVPTISNLIVKIEQLEWDLAGIKKELLTLQAGEMKSMTPEERAAARSSRVKAQNDRLHPSIKNIHGKPKSNTSIPTSEELQQLLLEDGINPEDNLGSCAIIEEREK